MTIDFTDLGTWFSARHAWLQDAARRLFQAGDVTEADLAELLTLCKREAGLVVSDDPDLVAVPISASSLNIIGSGVPLRLDVLSEVKGINALAPRNPLRFGSQHMTVIYGSNGSGKSGYIRVLKHVCGGRGLRTLHRNVFDPTGAEQSCKVAYTHDTTAKTLDWKPADGVHPDLRSISLFDSDCANVYINDENQVAYEPMFGEFREFSPTPDYQPPGHGRFESPQLSWRNQSNLIDRSMIGKPITEAQSLQWFQLFDNLCRLSSKQLKNPKDASGYDRVHDVLGPISVSERNELVAQLRRFLTPIFQRLVDTALAHRELRVQAAIWFFASHFRQLSRYTKDRLTASLHHHDARVVQAAIHALGATKHYTIQQLQPWMGHKSKQLRLQAFVACKSIADGALLRGLRDSEPAIQCAALYQLANRCSLTGTLSHAVRSLWDHSDDGIRAFALGLLWDRQDNNAFRRLKTLRPEVLRKFALH